MWASHVGYVPDFWESYSQWPHNRTAIKMDYSVVQDSAVRLRGESSSLLCTSAVLDSFCGVPSPSLRSEWLAVTGKMDLSLSFCVLRRASLIFAASLIFQKAKKRRIAWLPVVYGDGRSRNLFSSRTLPPSPSPSPIPLVCSLRGARALHFR